jgi:hypothetical protein
MTENEGIVFVYANKLNPTRDAFSEIAGSYGKSARREYVVNNSGVTTRDMDYTSVRNRMVVICQGLKSGEAVKVVLAGYSPLVAVLHDVAQEMGLEECYFIRNPQTRAFEEKRFVRRSP